MTALSAKKRRVLEAAPIGVDIVDDGYGRTPRYRYDDVDGRVARALWNAGFLVWDSVSPHGNLDWGLLRLTAAGRAALGAPA